LLKYDTLLILPGILFISMSSSIGNYLHATNRFKELLRNHIFALCVLLGVIWVGFHYKFSIEMVAIGMNLAFLTLLILHLCTINWLFKSRLELGFNLLLIRRLAKMKWFSKI
jgi:O-antigen/teichoic acid export membrane protein